MAGAGGEGDVSGEDGFLAFARRLRVVSGSPHPGEVRQGLVEAVAAQPRKEPTIPLSPAKIPWSQAELDRGICLPTRHCPFEGCSWMGECFDSLLRHLEESHDSQTMRAAVACLGPGPRRLAIYTIVNAAVSVRCQQRAPVVSLAHDRRGLRVFHASVCHPELQALICFFCGCVHPHLPEEWLWHMKYLVHVCIEGKKDMGKGIRGCPCCQEPRQKVAWRKAGEAVEHSGKILKSFMGLSMQQVSDFFGAGQFLRRFGDRGEGHPDLKEPVWAEELQQWQCKIRFAEGEVSVICTMEKTGVVLWCTARQRYVRNVSFLCAIAVSRGCRASLRCCQVGL